jgi:geranylgeranyl pyrophosphate synthase
MRVLLRQVRMMQRLRKCVLFGEKVGIAFQIKDDTFDFGTDDVGKPLGIDIKEKKGYAAFNLCTEQSRKN